MENYRYEDYSILQKHMPCVVNYGIERTKERSTNTANWHKNIEIQLCCKGSGYVLLDGVKTNLIPGDIVAVNSNSIHFTGTEEKIKYHCIIIDHEFFQNAGIFQSEFQFESVFRDLNIQQLILETVEIYKNTQDICYPAKLQCAILKLLIALRMRHTKTRPLFENENKYFTGIKEVILYIQNCYAQKISLETLAKVACINKYSLSKKFKAFTGITVVEYVNSYRCKQAVFFLKNGETVCNTAQKCGFQNVSFFTKTFKKITGNPPSFYKK